MSNNLNHESVYAILKQSRRPPGIDLISKNKHLVLFGCGGRGRRILAGLRQIGIEPEAFADNSPSNQGQVIDGLLVLSPVEAARLHAGAVFIVTIWSDRIGHPLDDISAQLAMFGISQVASFTALYELYPETFFPDFFLDHIDVAQKACGCIDEVFALWEDDESKSEYVRQLKLRHFLDFRAVDRNNIFKYPAYFPPEIFTLSTEETFVDCGAFDGDTYHDFIQVVNDIFFRYIGIEPDSKNFEKLAIRTQVKTQSHRVRLLQNGVADKNCVIRFAADGSMQSKRDESGNQKISCLTLDEICRNEHPTYLKMDIEGAELDALQGASQILSSHRPVLAVSAYHRSSDLWEVPRLIDKIVENYAFFLRPEKLAGWDLICYAIPREKMKIC